MTDDNFNRNTRKETAMFPKCVKRLTDILAVAPHLNKARAQYLEGIAIGAAASKSVLLADLATRLPGNATTTSKFRRLQDFILEVSLNFNAVAVLLMRVVGKLTNQSLTLAMDRTNWEARGNDANTLVLSVCLGYMGLPIFWMDLRMAGNSDTPSRIGVDRIHVLVGDHYCPIISRTMTGGYKRSVYRFSILPSKTPVKWAFFEKWTRSKFPGFRGVHDPRPAPYE